TSYIDGKTESGQMMRRKNDFHVLLAAHANNHHLLNTDFKGQEVKFEITKFISGAKKTVVEDPQGKRYLKLVEAGSGKREDHFLEEGSVANLHNVLFAFNKDTEGAINIDIDEEGNYTINSPFSGDYMRMADQKKGEVTADSTQKLMLRSLYNIGGMRFVFPDPVIRGKYKVVHDKKLEEKGNDAVFVNVSTKAETQQVVLLGMQSNIGEFIDISMGGLDIHLRYGSREIELPFSLRLDDFIAKKYPGTANNPTPSYSSFKSKVTLIDGDETSKHDIYMNHVLDHSGYRFF